MKTSLHDVAERLLATARSAPAGRGAETLQGGHNKTLRQTVIALLEDRRLDEHESPGEATLQVLRGRVRVQSADETIEAEAGELLIIPASRHSLHALADSVILLTVAKLIA
ncbi:quercetin dioxygenase-like cupin family protein [Actinoplanes tereljensis]|uniref:LuxR family transcriptional regulator n=1 Tax=Paractinoplanes tereljensis TaxID=571912 RepID=A0A919NYI8_9ACTN|nr:cupin domain-containing protein [Actinoplanes tereljensis]GIF25677.1 LuxR family transcriptional regulator [Actinoplanes tereljensis]